MIRRQVISFMSMNIIIIETKLLKWTKWRTGMVLKFGNLTLLSLEELSGRLFNGDGRKMKIMLEGGRWDEHSLDITVYGIDIEVQWQAMPNNTVFVTLYNYNDL